MTILKKRRETAAILSSARCTRVVLLLSIVSFAAQAQSSSQSISNANAVIAPPKAGLLPVHTPDLNPFEPDVRAQLQSLQESLAAAATNRGVTGEKLGEAYGSLGQVYQAYSLFPQAEECYRNAHVLNPRDFKWTYLLANILQGDGRTDESASFYEQVRKLRPDYQAAAVNLGNIYLRQNRLNEARANLVDALKIDANCAACLYGLGQVALSARNYKLAAEYLEHALKEVPDANRIHYALAMAYRGLGDTEKARSHLEQQGPVGVRVADPLLDALRQMARGARLHLVQGRKAFDAGSFSDAADEFRKAVAANPNGVTARVNLGAALAQMGDIAGAVEQYQQALRVDSGNASAHFNLGFLFAKLNQHEQAIAQFQAVLALNSNDADARFGLAQELEKSQRADEAFMELSRVVLTDPDNEDAMLELVKLMLGKKQYKPAVDTLEKANSRFPNKGRTAIMLAYMLASSPQYNLRNGARALELATLVYDATGLVNHGAIVAMSLAELGRCAEAAQLQRQLIAAAERDRRPDMGVKLQEALRQYENANSCRPRGEMLESDSSAQPERKRP